jgi:hypothetical protein
MIDMGSIYGRGSGSVEFLQEIKFFRSLLLLFLSNNSMPMINNAFAMPCTHAVSCQ